MKIAYVGCQESLMEGTRRRDNASDHDREFLCAREVFQKKGDQLEEVDWRGFDFDSCDFDLIFVRTTWDYVQYRDEFADFLKRSDTADELNNRPKSDRHNRPNSDRQVQNNFLIYWRYIIGSFL